jgi:hypothetical protein
MIQTLIPLEGSFQLVRDKILSILVTEIANQQVLAAQQLEDPDDWKIRVYAERANPWDQWLNITPTTDTSPIANIWYDNTVFPQGHGNVKGRQKNEAIYNIDCYGFAIASPDLAGGHNPGDREAAYIAHRAVNLISKILMAAEYTYLDLQRGSIWKRWVDSITVYQPEFEGRTVQQVVGARIAFRVEFNEFTPQFIEETLEYISTTIRREEDGEILAQVDVDFT